ncbi:MAG: NAD(+)/NADH kinase [Clostridia bacterium]|nr:NAD(+)/NADH kinase [Clostridia bacterium]
MRIAIIPNMTREDAASVTADVIKELDTLGIEYMLSNELFGVIRGKSAVCCDEEQMLHDCDTVIAIGGDGSIISAAHKALRFDKPVLGVNAGRLAFLAGLERHELSLLRSLIDGEYSVDKRMMLCMQIIRDGQVLCEDLCLNDAVISRTGAAKLTGVAVKADGRKFCEYLGDGIIVATPTGSTAYSLSAGGPVVDPSIESILLTPVCSHSLTARPMIFGDSTTLELSCTTSGETSVTCDGREPFIIPDNAVIRIFKAEKYAYFIRIKSDTFADVLMNKLK